MRISILHDDEDARLGELKSYHILDTQPEAAFDDLTRPRRSYLRDTDRPDSPHRRASSMVQIHGRQRLLETLAAALEPAPTPSSTARISANTA